LFGLKGQGGSQVALGFSFPQAGYAGDDGSRKAQDGSQSGGGTQG
jgi:hypothetical protein